MITDLDPQFVSLPASFAGAAPRTPPIRHHGSRSGHGRLFQSREERESLFERAYGSLWEPGLLDRLTAPLTRHHE